MKVINLISISLLSLGIFGNNSSWSMEEEDTINNSNQGGMTNGPQQNSEYNATSSPMNGIILEPGKLNNNEINMIVKQSSHPLAKYDNRSLSDKLGVIKQVTAQAQETDGYKNISQEIKKEADDLTSDIINSLQKSMADKFANHDNKDLIVDTTLVEFAYQMAKLQFTPIGFLEDSQLKEPNINDNLGNK